MDIEIRDQVEHLIGGLDAPAIAQMFRSILTRMATTFESPYSWVDPEPYGRLEKWLFRAENDMIGMTQ